MAKQRTTKSLFTDYFQTPDGQKFSFDPSSEKSRYEAGERADSHYLALKATREAQAQREVTGQEMLNNMLDHQEDRDPRQKMLDSEFKPTLNTKPAGRYDKHRKALLERIRQRDLAALPPEERQLTELDAIEAEQQAVADGKAKKQAHLKSERVAAALADLNTLLDSMRFDPNRSKSEIVRVQQAIEQWETVDGCQETGEEMLKAVFGFEDSRDAAHNSDTLAKIAELEATLKARKTEPEQEPQAEGYVDPMRTYEPEPEAQPETPKATIDTSNAPGQQIADLSYQSFERDWPLENRQEIFSAEQALREGNEAAAMECLNKYTG